MGLNLQLYGFVLVYFFALWHASILVKQNGRTSPRKPTSLWLEESKTESESDREAGKWSWRQEGGGDGGSGGRTRERRAPSRSEKVTEEDPTNPWLTCVCLHRTGAKILSEKQQLES